MAMAHQNTQKSTNFNHISTQFSLSVDIRILNVPRIYYNPDKMSIRSEHLKLLALTMMGGGG